MSESFGSAPVAVLLAAAIVAIVITGLLSAVELSLANLSRAYVEDLVEEGRPRANKLVPLVEYPERTNLSLRGARVTLQTVAIVGATIALVDLLGDVNMSWWGTFLIATIAIGIVEFFAVSVLPVLWVKRNYVAVASAGAGIAAFLVRLSHIFDPLIRTNGRRERRTNEEAQDARLAVADDLREIVDEVGEPEDFDDEDKEMLRSVFEFGQTLVREVMVPRTAMVVIDADKSLDKAVRLFVRSGFSRIPVIEDDIDDVIGIVYFKDVIRRLTDDPAQKDVPVRNALRQAAFVPEMVRVDDELRAMQTENTHLALVVDEYGGIAGLVTMEDLLEELVGEVTDEHDHREMEPEEIEPGRWRLPARFGLGDLEELLDVEIDQETVDSVGGLLTWAVGRVPVAGATGEAFGVRMEAEYHVGRRHELGTVLVEKAEEERDD